MLEYEWGNPSQVMLTGDDDSAHDSDNSRQFFDHYDNTPSYNDGFFAGAGAAFSHHHHPQQLAQVQSHFHPFYDPRSTYYGSASYPPPTPPMLGLDTVAAAGGGGYLMVPKTEELSPVQAPVGAAAVDFTARLGLNLGGRTYFSAADEDFVSRLYRRSRASDGVVAPVNIPRCQAEGCGADLTHAKHYHRRHKVCEYHSKAATVVANGLTQRFCQQCSRFHLLSEFDNGKRSCRKRLADHNRRRRKSNQQPNQDHQKSAGRNSSMESFARSPSESGGQQTSSSVTIAISPPRMTLDCFRGRANQGMAAASASGSIYFSASYLRD